MEVLYQDFDNESKRCKILINMSKGSFEFGRFLGMLLNNPEAQIQRAVNDSRRAEIATIADTLSVAKTAKATLDAVGLGTTDALWDNGAYFRDMDKKQAEVEMKYEAERAKQKQYEVEHHVEITATSERHSHHPGFFGDMDDSQVSRWVDDKINQDKQDYLDYGQT